MKCSSDTRLQMRELVMPNHANPQNTIFGGQVMAWIDIAAAMVAAKHAASQVVTIHVDELTFKAPVKVGMHLTIDAQVTFVGKTSIEVETIVVSENPITGEARETTTAYVTLVAVDEFGKPKPAPPLTCNTEEEKKRFEEGKSRYEERKKKTEIKKALNERAKLFFFNDVIIIISIQKTVLINILLDIGGINFKLSTITY